jgi:hypothetical protein
MPKGMVIFYFLPFKVVHFRCGIDQNVNMVKVLHILALSQYQTL